jgi:hypothetical protein
MITWEKGDWTLNGYGLSTDTKPTVYETPTGKTEGIPNSSTIYEMDTGDIYMWDAENSQWRKQ